VNFFQPSFKLAAKERDGAKVRKRYHKPATPHQRLIEDPRTPDGVKKRLEREYAALDPVRLLRDLRAAQTRLVEIADTPSEALTEEIIGPSLDTFLSGLRTSWKSGDVRPTARIKPKTKRERRRPDPLIAVTSELKAWFEAEPWRTARQLLEKLQAEKPGEYPEALLRTLQRRL
jgi:hypothetical protein